MFNAKQIETFLQLPQPLLTVYLNTSGTDPSRHPLHHESSVWLKKEAKSVELRVSSSEREDFEQQLERIKQFLEKRTPNEKALAIFAGTNTWQVVPLQVPVANELHWGRPGVAQLLWLIDEHELYCVVVVDHKGARFYRYQLRELERTAEKTFDFDTSEWKRKDIGHIAGQEIQKTRGSQRDIFEHRMDAQYAHACTATANQTVAFSKQYNCAAVIVIGEDRLSRAIEAAMPRDILPHVETVQEDFAGLTDRELERRLEPIVEDRERTQQAAKVHEFLDSQRGAARGIEESLFLLQQGSVRSLLLARDLDADLQQCQKCGWVERSGDPQCSACGGEKRGVSLRQVLPELAKLHKAKIHIVSGDAAEILRKEDGMGAWLRGAKAAVAR